MLLCAHTLLCCLSECFHVASLLVSLSGDGEENPGLITEEKLNEIIRTQKAVLEKVTKIKKSQASFEARVEGRLSKIEERLEILGEAPLRLASLEKFASEAETSIATVSQKVDEFVTKSSTDWNALLKRLDDLENPSRQNNIIIRGIKEDMNET